MDLEQRILQLETRRHFFRNCGLGVGKIALGTLMAERLAHTAPAGVSPLAAKKPHFPAKIKSIIYLFMAGGPSQFELFDYKPELQKFDGKPAPDSFLKGKRFAFMDTFTKDVPKMLGTKRAFKQYGQSGAYFSELLPHTAAVADDLVFLRGVSTENFNHGPAKMFTNTGFTRAGRPSMGAWITYGIGSEGMDLPGFVVLQSGPRGPRSGAALWSSGFLPTAYQGVPFRSTGDPILDLSSPNGVSLAHQKDALDAIGDLNRAHLLETGDDEIATRIASYEMAFRMQSSGPELIDLGKESKDTLAMYGAEPGKGSFANNCLLARRLVERGVRFVQLYHSDWDHHGGPTQNLGAPLEQVTREIDQPCAALVRDLKQRGMLDETLVIWSGEFGRTPMGEVREAQVGRNHHIDAYTLWMAGGGTRPGITVGGTDELGFSPAEERIEVHDIHATILHQLGLDHTKLTHKFQGRDFRLTDVGGKILKKLLA
ncbi:MAG: DUF1501 domain-containing protein [Acidobacteriia bacterium]|nr:DUF1501 domain-containing protein [Terriglobia bacterium]